MKKDEDQSKDQNQKMESEWPASASPRKPPYTEAELELLMEGFILGMDYDPQSWDKIVEDYGEEEAKEILKQGLRAGSALSRRQRTMVIIEPPERCNRRRYH